MGRQRKFPSFLSSHSPRCVLCVQIAFTLAIVVTQVSGHPSPMNSPLQYWISGLGALLPGLKTARAAGGGLRIARAQTQILLVLNLTNIDQFLRPYTTVEECYQ
jgi:hypothetical protein